MSNIMFVAMSVPYIGRIILRFTSGLKGYWVILLAPEPSS
jgi:hypothetical protein